MKFKAAVVGLGKIGQGYDYDCHDESLITTHASAYHFHPSFDLVAGMDLNTMSCLAFEKKYKAQTFNCLDEMMETLNPDVISIAVSTNIHYEIFNKIISYYPKAILLEKPIAVSVNQAQDMVSAAGNAGIPLIVNYIRRFEPGTNKLKEMISNGVIGDIYKGIVWYGKGLKNNGSHFIDILMYLFGKVKNIHLISRGRNFDALGYEDAEPDFQLEFCDTIILFQSTRSECFSLTEFALIGTKGTIFYNDDRIEYRLTKNDPFNKGYTKLQEEPDRIKTYFERYQYFVVDSLSGFLKKQTTINSDGNSALETLKIVQKILSLRERF